VTYDEWLDEYVRKHPEHAKEVAHVRAIPLGTNIEEWEAEWTMWLYDSYQAECSSHNTASDQLGK
jgi:hypothetical protein